MKKKLAVFAAFTVLLSLLGAVFLHPERRPAPPPDHNIGYTPNPVVGATYGVVTTRAALSALPGPATWQTQTVWVNEVAASYLFSPGTSLPVDGKTVLTVAGGGVSGQWVLVPGGFVTSQGSIAAATNPMSILAGSIGWWDAGNSGATSASWPDQSGNGNTWTTIGHNPTLSTGGQGGRSYYHFSGAQGLTNNITSNASAWTVWAVGRTSSAGANQFACVFGGTAGINLGFSGAGGSTNDVGTYVSGWLDSGHTATSVTSIAAVGVPLTNFGFRVDGAVTLPIASGNGPYPSSGVGYLGASSSVPQNPLTGDVYELAVWNSALSTTQLAALDRYAQAKYQLTATTNLLVADGNSFFAGNGASGASYYLGQQILGMLGTGFGSTYINNGVGGETTPQMLTYSQAHTFPLYSAGLVPRMVDAACEVTNDIYFGATAAQAYANLVQYSQASRAAGFKVVVNTVLPRSNAGTPAGFNATRLAANALIQAGWPTFADGLADIASDPRMGCNGCETNTTYFSGDDVHPNNVGYEILAGYYASAILAIPQQ